MSRLAATMTRASVRGYASLALELSVILAALATIPVVVAREQGDISEQMVQADWALWSVFAIDYLLLALLSGNPRRYCRTHWLHAVVVVVSIPLLPELFEAARIARIASAVRLVRLVVVAAEAVRELRSVIGRPGMAYMFAATAIIVLSGGAGLAVIEPDTVKGDVGTGIWWAVVTTTTVGYGDVAPTTPVGRLLGGVLMLTGIGMVAAISASVSAYFVRQDCEKENAVIDEMSERLARIESLLEERAGTANSGRSRDDVVAPAAPDQSGSTPSRSSS